MALLSLFELFRPVLWWAAIEHIVQGTLLYGNALLTALGIGAMAATTIPDDLMTAHLNAGGAMLAYKYAPVFFFAQALNQPPCYPTWAFSGSVSFPDIYDAAHQTRPAPQCQYPDVGCRCRNPGVPVGNQGPSFPIYYSFKKCNDTEIRVAYNLYYEKDGARVRFVETGHDQYVSSFPDVVDWERVIIIHSKDTTINHWRPTRALFSAHAGYHSYAWNDIQSTLSTPDAESGAGPFPNGIRGLDHPKAYVAWSKHPFFDDQNTRWNDPISQSTDNAYRGQDWWKFVGIEHYILSDRSTPAGQAMGAVNWGSADSHPPSVHDSICNQA